MQGSGLPVSWLRARQEPGNPGTWLGNPTHAVTVQPTCIMCVQLVAHVRFPPVLRVRRQYLHGQVLHPLGVLADGVVAHTVATEVGAVVP